MNKEDIIALAKAGFTAEQIAALAAAPDSAAAPAVPAAPAAPAAPAVPAVPAAPEIAPDVGQEILRKLGVISDNMQAAALLGATQPPVETAEDIIASIINPTHNNK